MMYRLEVSIIENIKRKSPSPLEEGQAFKTFVEEKGWGSVNELSFKRGKSTSYITKRIGLLDLPLDIIQNIANDRLSPSNTEELLSVKDRQKQSRLGVIIAKRHLTVKSTRNIIKNDPFYCENSEIIDVRVELQSFNKAIVALRVAMSRINDVIEENEVDTNKWTKCLEQKELIDKDNEYFLIRELLLYHSKCLHRQIDDLLMAKEKYARNIFKCQKMLNQ